MDGMACTCWHIPYLAEVAHELPLLSKYWENPLNRIYCEKKLHPGLRGGDSYTRSLNNGMLCKCIKASSKRIFETLMHPPLPVSYPLLPTVLVLLWYGKL